MTHLLWARQRTLALVLIASLALPSSADTGTVWVFLTDKNGNDGRPIPWTVHADRELADLPVTQQYAAQLESYGSLRTRSRWLNAVSIELPDADAERLGDLPFVAAVSPVRATRRAVPPAHLPARKTAAPHQDYGPIRP